MSEIIFGIPSYNRPNKQLLLDYLSKNGFKKNEIVISTQTERDYVSYRQNYGQMANIIYRSGTCVGDNKNTLMDVLSSSGKHFVICSDKVKSFQILRDKKLKDLQGKKEILETILRCYERTKELGGCCFGVYPTNNAGWMQDSVFVNAFLIGCFVGFFPGERFRYDRNFLLKEDYEMTARLVSEGRRPVRFNNLGLKETFHTEGGSHELWTTKGDAVNARMCKMILAKYPKFFTENKRRRHELCCHFDTKKFPLKWN